MFRAAHRSSTGALHWFIYTCGDRPLSSLSGKFYSICNNEELPEEWRESISVPIYRKGDKTDFSNYRGISLLSTTYQRLSKIVLSQLTPYAEEIIGDHQCSFRCNRSITGHVFCIRQILDKKWEYNEAVHQLLTRLQEFL